MPLQQSEIDAIIASLGRMLPAMGAMRASPDQNSILPRDTGLSDQQLQQWSQNLINQVLATLESYDASGARTLPPAEPPANPVNPPPAQQPPAQQPPAQQQSAAPAGWQPAFQGQPPPGPDTPVDWKKMWSGTGGNSHFWGTKINPEFRDPATGYVGGGMSGNIFVAPHWLPGQGIFDQRSWADQRNQGAVLQGKGVVPGDSKYYGPGKIASLSDLQRAGATGQFPDGSYLPGVGPNEHPALQYVRSKSPSGTLTYEDFQRAGVPAIGWANWTPPTSPQQTAPQQPASTGAVAPSGPAPAPAPPIYEPSGYSPSSGYEPPQDYQSTSQQGYYTGAALPAGYSAGQALAGGWMTVNGPNGTQYIYNQGNGQYQQVR